MTAAMASSMMSSNHIHIYGRLRASKEALFLLKNLEDFVNKPLTKGSSCGNICKLSARGAKRVSKSEEIWKNLKKLLTNGIACGILTKLCDEGRKSGARQQILKSFKNLKKVLDKRIKMC